MPHIAHQQQLRKRILLLALEVLTAARWRGKLLEHPLRRIGQGFALDVEMGAGADEDEARHLIRLCGLGSSQDREEEESQEGGGEGVDLQCLLPPFRTGGVLAVDESRVQDGDVDAVVLGGDPFGESPHAGEGVHVELEDGDGAFRAGLAF